MKTSDMKFVKFLQVLNETKSEGTAKIYTYSLNAFAEWLCDNGGDIDRLTRHDIAGYINAMKNGTDGTGRKKSASTLNNRFAAIRAFAEYMNRKDVIEAIDVPAAPKLKDQAPKSLNRNEKNRLMRDVERNATNRIDDNGKVVEKGSVKYAAIVNLLVLSGLRISELVALDIDDIGAGKIVVRGGKGNKERVVPLHKEAALWIARYMEERRGIDVDTPALFLSRLRRRIDVRSVQKMLKERYGISPHTLRHTFASEFINDKGKPISAAATLLGHSDINVTARYAKPSFEQLADMINE